MQDGSSFPLHCDLPFHFFVLPFFCYFCHFVAFKTGRTYLLDVLALMFVFNLVHVTFSSHLEKQTYLGKKVIIPSSCFFLSPSVMTLMQIFVIKGSSVISWGWDIGICFHDDDDLAVLFFQALTVAEQNLSSKGQTRNECVN